MSADGDSSSPSKKRRTENTTTNCSTTASQTLPTLTTTSATASTPTSTPPLTTRTTTTASCASVKETTTSSCLEACQKDSIIAQILAGTDADFGESTLCPPGVFFDDSCYSSTASGTSCSFSPHDSWVSLVLYRLLGRSMRSFALG